MTDRDWLAKLKVGDKVLIRGKLWRDHHESATVEKLLRLHLVAGGIKFRLKNGYVLVPKGRYRPPISLVPWDAVIRLQEERDEADGICRRIETYHDWRELSIVALRAIAALLPGKETKDA